MVVDAARQYLARFRFYGDDPFRAVGSLSGGERTRLALAKLLLVPRNLLLLDEPTNHLDIPACEILEEALRALRGHGGAGLARPGLPRPGLDAGAPPRRRRAEFHPGGYADYHGRSARPSRRPPRRRRSGRSRSAPAPTPPRATVTTTAADACASRSG
jgi:ATP-binding cassette subfamily F protein 3